MWHPQIENVTGQSNQAPGEYVSTSLSTPWHGAGVASVRYFETQNGNSVASNVVTEATGAAIPLTTLLGYLAEGARTNLARSSQDLSNATYWTLTATVTANSVAAPDGTTTATKLDDNSAAAQQSAVEGTVVANDSVTGTHSVWIKQGTSQYAEIEAGLTGGTAKFSGCIIDLSDGSFIARTGAGFSNEGMTATSYPSGWWRVEIPLTNNSTGNVSASITIRPAWGSKTQPVDVSATGYVYAWGYQFEAAAFASSYIATTTVTVTRNGDVLTYALAGNFSNTEGTWYHEVTCNAQSNATLKIMLQGATGGESYVDSNALRLFDGTAERIFGAATTPLTSPKKLVVRFSATTSNCDGWVDGTKGTTRAFDGSMNMTTPIGVGNGPSGQLDGTIRNVKVWTVALSDNQIASL
jgi:hypothetical protein